MNLEDCKHGCTRHVWERRPGWRADNCKSCGTMRDEADGLLQDARDERDALRAEVERLRAERDHFKLAHDRDWPAIVALRDMDIAEEKARAEQMTALARELAECLEAEDASGRELGILPMPGSTMERTRAALARAREAGCDK